MAKVTLTFTDTESGNVDISLEATPPMPGDAPGAPERTNAQDMALSIMQVLHQAGDSPMEVEGILIDE